MTASDLLANYAHLMRTLHTAVTSEQWERLSGIQDEIESVQEQFERLSQSDKQHPDIQHQLRQLFQEQQRLTQEVSQAKKNAAQHIRKLRTAKTQQQGYLNDQPAVVPPVLYDSKQ